MSMSTSLSIIVLKTSIFTALYNFVCLLLQNIEDSKKLRQHYSYTFQTTNQVTSCVPLSESTSQNHYLEG